MEASKTTQADRKDMQAAIKDINTILEPKPKLNVIGSADFLANQIVKAVAACIGEDENGNPVWTDERAGKLNPATVAVYEQIVATMPGQPVAEVAAEMAEEKVEEPKPEATAKLAGKDCEAFLAAAGPDTESEACAACAKFKECREKAEKKAAKAAVAQYAHLRHKKTDEEKAAEKLAKEQAKIAKQAEKATAKEVKETKQIKKTMTKKPSQKRGVKTGGINAMIEAILFHRNQPIKKTELINYADAVYKQHGATSEIKKDFPDTIRVLFTALPLLGLATMENELFTYTGPTILN